MNGDIAEQPLARAVLRHLSATRGSSDPVGSFARTVLNGEASLRDAADFSWHSQALAEGAVKAQQGQDRMTPEQRAECDRQAAQLQNRPEAVGDGEQR